MIAEVILPQKVHELKRKGDNGMANVLLISTFEGGYQPLTLATATTPLLEAGMSVSVLDTYVDGIREDLLATPDLVAISIPLFDSLHPGLEIAKRVREVNPKAHITFFGQYATINSARLIGTYGDSCVSGEWEEALSGLARQLSGEKESAAPGLVSVNDLKPGHAVHPYRPRKHFRVPARHLLPPLHKYPQPQVERLTGSKQIVGSTEITRGCHHTCLYCAVFAAYDGKVLLIPEEIVVEDVRQCVEGGMTHLTFIDADFFNAKYHGIKVLRKLHQEFPDLTYDFTTRVDHLLENQETIREMSDLGVRFITSALEFPSEEVLNVLVKEISLDEVRQAIRFLRTTNIKLNPTFILFNPWIRLEDLVAFHTFVDENDLDTIIDPIQYETRLHLYKGSPLLQIPSVQQLDLTEQEFHMDWKHPDTRVDALYEQTVTPPQPGVFKRCCLKC
jgi:hopanoid C-3 methylase